MKRSEIYRDAADLIDKVGRARGVFKHRNGKMCMVGALRQVAFGTVKEPSVKNTSWLLGPMKRVTDIEPTHFSDFHCRNKRDMSAALRIAADIQQTKGD